MLARVGEGSICGNFTKFNRRTVNGPFLSATGINQEVSGGCWIWVVVLFTDDWLASQNHQIHLPTVTFITVIFKVTASCCVSQRWPPQMCLHLLPLPPFPSSSYFVTHSPVVSPVPPLRRLPSPPFNYFCLSFFSACVLPHLAGQVEGSRVMEVWRQTGKRGENKTPTLSPPLFHCLQGVCRIPILFVLQWWREIRLHCPSCCLTLENLSSSPARDECKWKFQLRAHWSHLRGSSRTFSEGVIKVEGQIYLFFFKKKCVFKGSRM